MGFNAKRYNDFELLYMIGEDSKEALEIMFEKYKPLINYRIKSFNIRESYIEDYYQECLIALYDATKRYDSNSNISFTKFLDLILQRKIMSLLRKNKKYFEVNCICENVDIVEAYESRKENLFEEKIEELENKLSTFELKVFELKYKKELKNKEIAKALDVGIDKVYNACDRIKSKANKTKV